MPPGNKVGLKRAMLGLALAIVLLLLFPVSANVLGLGLNLALVAAFLLVVLVGCAIFFVGAPLFVWIIGENGYRIFIEPYARAWHIRRIRDRRLLDEAAAREHSDSA
jgi:hypothetical protein